MGVIQSAFFVSFVSLFVCSQCSLESDLMALFKQLNYVSPSEEQLQNFLEQVLEAAMSQDLETLFSDSSVISAFLEEIKQIFSETAGQISLQVPNSKLIPILQREVKSMIEEVIKEEVDRADITRNRVIVSVPSSGVCGNTYRIDMDVDITVKLCSGGGFWDFFCNSASGNLDAHGCFRFDVNNWIIDINTVNSDADFDGSGILGSLLEWIAGDYINAEIRSIIQRGVKNIDLGQDVDDEVEKVINSVMDEYSPQLVAVVEGLNMGGLDKQMIDSLLLQVKGFVLDILSTEFFTQPGMEIEQDYLTISVGF